MRTYKTIRIDVETKFMLNELIKYYEFELIKNKDEIISKYEDEINDKLKNYSASLMLNVTVGSILSEALSYFKSSNFSNNEILKFKAEINSLIDIPNNISVGSITPRFFLSNKDINYINELKYELDEFKNNKSNIGYVVKFIIYVYYKKHEESLKVRNLNVKNI